MSVEKKKKKMKWKCILFPGCLSCNKTNSDKIRSPPLSKQSSSIFQRLSISEVSDPSSATFVDDLSSSLIGSKLPAFSLAELKSITHGFAPSNLLGEGGFGPVYKGFVHDQSRPGLEAQPVAVKLLDLYGLQGHKEWLAEIIILGQLRHPNLVKLIGYCCEEEHRLLVYDYMPRGSLERHLFTIYSAAIPWSTRMKIALGAAKGLAFLHEADKPVIFRDFKTSNILLDVDFTPKLSDFGLAKDGPEGEDTHITTTQIIGTQGYAAPEYIMTGHLTTKSDVYGYGVVLLELLTGKRALDRNRPTREQNLVGWARPLLKDPKKLHRYMDPRLEAQYSTKAAQKAASLAHKCLSHNPKCRPTMSDVVSALEPLLDLNDWFFEPFVYVAPIDQSVSLPCRVKEEGIEKEWDGKSRRHHRRGRVRSTNSLATFSDFSLYKKYGNNSLTK